MPLIINCGPRPPSGSRSAARLELADEMRALRKQHIEDKFPKNGLRHLSGGKVGIRHMRGVTTNMADKTKREERKCRLKKVQKACEFIIQWLFVFYHFHYHLMPFWLYGCRGERKAKLLKNLRYRYGEVRPLFWYFLSYYPSDPELTWILALPGPLELSVRHSVHNRRVQNAFLPIISVGLRAISQCLDSPHF